MDKIATWLDAVISVHEAAATAAAAGHGGRWVQGMPEEHRDPDMRYGWDGDCVYLSRQETGIFYQCLSDEIAALTVLHDPESVMRRCVADRESLEDYVRTVAIRNKAAALIQQAQEQGSQPDPHVLDDWDRARREAAIMRPFIRRIAEGYGWKEEGGDE